MREELIGLFMRVNPVLLLNKTNDNSVGGLPEEILLNITHLSLQPYNLPLLATIETCSSGTYIVTGANSGLGFKADTQMVALGTAKIILVVRNVKAGETAKTEIEAARAISKVAKVWALDLASYDSIKAFAKRVVTELDHIDALTENAGVATYQRVVAERHLMDVTINVLSTFLLGVLLLPKMSESAQ